MTELRGATIWGRRNVVRVLGKQVEYRVKKIPRSNATSRFIDTVVLEVRFECGHEGHIRRKHDAVFWANEALPCDPHTHMEGPCSTCAGEMVNG